MSIFVLINMVSLKFYNSENMKILNRMSIEQQLEQGATIFAQGPLMQKFSLLRAAPLFFGKYKVKKVSFKIYSEA